MSDIPEETIVEPDLGSTLSAREKALRNLFVEEYLTDYDALGAAIRVGYPQSFAKEYAVRFMHEPYVLQQIKLKETTPVAEDDNEAMKKRIMTGLIREANYRGPGCSQSARVAALAKLASIAGMDAPSRSKTEITGPNGSPFLGGQFVIPGVMTVEQWEAAAAAQQASLINSGSVGTPGISEADMQK